MKSHLLLLAPLFVVACSTSKPASTVDAAAVSGAIMEAALCSVSDAAATQSFSIQVPVATGKATGRLSDVGNEAHFIMLPQLFSCEQGQGKVLWSCVQTNAIDPNALDNVSVEKGAAGTVANILHPDGSVTSIACQVPLAN